MKNKVISLKNKNIVIFGASSGLGKALAYLLSECGSNLFLLSRSIEKVQFPFKAQRIKCDVTDFKSVISAFKTLDSLVQKLDILIYCSGIGLYKDLRNVTLDEVTSVIDTNLKGAILVEKEVYRRMAKKKEGCIVNIISTSGIRARALETVYCATKWGLKGFNDSLQLAGEKNGIKVLGIYPGGMRSKNFWKLKPDKDTSDFLKSEDVARQIIDFIQAPSLINSSELIIER